MGERWWQWLRHPRLDSLPIGPTARPSLTELAQQFKTDKWGLHRYTPHYEHHFGPWRDRRFTMLEIGIGGYARKRGGASLRMWKAFFGDAQIVGLDIEDKSSVEEHRIRTYQGSQTDPAVLERILADQGEISIIVDDGSHRPAHVRETFARLFPRLAPEGLYAIEDIQTSYWPAWGGSADLHDPATSMALVKDLLDGLHHEEFPFLDEGYEPTYTDLHVQAVHAYHNLVIIEKGSNREGTNSTRTPRLRPGAPPARPVAEQRAPYRHQP
ncbi:hypothetical protein GCM10011519_32030 [Marmoricola endophyticus]|uniref:Class I SAM-dependent methyltransferase n=1 Tax=Marmoricola endophyticus TaxID=2040280 RepID=A0A917BQY2_9ACTN|nr:class I SAM-dependent methyltransferase [Marmoricola endophyticus]GGF55694.1 hypothetical protein GCM10011519_32030 [Marmoricola endophyticus]